MKTRPLATIVAISSISIFTACGGSGTDHSVIPVPSLTPPTVTVTAPATATVGFPFSISWTSTGAISCAADFDSGVGVTASVTKTETTAGTKTYSVTCTGAGGNTTDSKTVVINTAPTAEGAWQGSTSDDRAVTGVVTHPDDSTTISQFFLLYSAAGNHSTPAGFVAGGGGSVVTTSTTGNFASGTGSNALREFNFEGNGAAGGNLAATYTGKASFDGSFTTTPLSATWSFAGNMTAYDTAHNSPIYTSFTPSFVADWNTFVVGVNDILLTFTDGGTPWTIDPTAATPTFAGKIVFNPYVETNWFDGSNYATLHFPTGHTIAFSNSNGTVTYDAGTRTLSWGASTSDVNYPSDGTFADTYPSDFTCDGPSAAVVCTIFVNTTNVDHSGTGGLPPHSFLPIKGKVTLTFDDASLTTYHGVVHWAQGVSTPWPIADLTFTGSVAVVSSVTKTYTSTYNATYENAPSLNVVQGAYTGTAGISAATASATLTIAVDGSITGTSATCTYSGNVAPHAIGNVYDVTMTFTGGSCAYASGGTFTGAATYDATSKQLTLTAVSAARDEGFMAIVTKP